MVYKESLSIDKKFLSEDIDCLSPDNNSLSWHKIKNISDKDFLSVIKNVDHLTKIHMTKILYHLTKILYHLTKLHCHDKLSLSLDKHSLSLDKKSLSWQTFFIIWQGFFVKWQRMFVSDRFSLSVKKLTSGVGLVRFFPHGWVCAIFQI